MHCVVQDAVLEHLTYTGVNHGVVGYVARTTEIGWEICRYPGLVLELETCGDGEDLWRDVSENEGRH